VKRFAGSRLRVTLDVMMARPDNLIAQARAHVATATLAMSMLLIAAGAGWPQAASPPPSLGVQDLGVQNPGVQDPGVHEPAQQSAPPQAGPAPSSPAPREENPGLINEIGKLFGKLPTLKSPQQTIEDLNARARDAAKDASDSLSHLAGPSSMVSGRMACPASANGAPDCKTGADKLCQSKGFKEGKSLDTDAAEKCSAKVYLPGHKREPGDCRTENYVTRALCQ
jgi:hypothetical protein